MDGDQRGLSTATQTIGNRQSDELPNGGKIQERRTRSGQDPTSKRVMADHHPCPSSVAQQGGGGGYGGEGRTL